MRKIILGILALASSGAFAVEEYYGLSRSIRALGMGGAFYTMSDDEYALFYNPAGLSNYRGNGSMMFSLAGQISTGATSAIQTLTEQKGGNIDAVVRALSSFQGKPVSAGFSIFPHYVRKYFAMGLLLADTKTNFAFLGKELDTTVDLTMIVDNGLILGFGRPVFSDDFHLGMNLKGIVRAGGKKSFTVLDIASSAGFDLDPNTLGGVGGGIDFDLGAIYDIRGLPFGVLNQVSFTLTNLLASDLTMFKSSTGGNPPGLQRMLTLGARSTLPGVGPFDQFHLVMDLSEFHLGGEAELEYGARKGSLFKHVNLGVEAPMNGWFVLRAGFHQGYLTAGFGIQTAPLKLDFATYGEELSTGINRLGSRRFALRLALGFGSAAPPPVPPKSSLNIRTDEKTSDSDQPEQTAPAIKSETEKVESQKTDGDAEKKEVEPAPSKAKDVDKTSEDKEAENSESRKPDGDRFNPDSQTDSGPESKSDQ